jgi:hypothetical protein
MRYVLVPEIMLDGASVLPVIREITARGVVEHVWMNREFNTSGFPYLGYDRIRSAPCHRPAMERGKDIGR